MSAQFSQRERVAFDLGYRISDDGLILNPQGSAIGGFSHNGYLRFSVPGHGSCSAHRLAAFQKFGDAIFETGIEVRHMDGNRSNCAGSNLELGTKVENAADKSPETRRRAAINASLSTVKHDHSKVISLYRETGSYSKVMAALGIKSKGTISFIIRKSMAAQAA